MVHHCVAWEWRLCGVALHNVILHDIVLRSLERGSMVRRGRAFRCSFIAVILTVDSTSTSELIETSKGKVIRRKAGWLQNHRNIFFLQYLCQYLSGTHMLFSIRHKIYKKWNDKSSHDISIYHKAIERMFHLYDLVRKETNYTSANSEAKRRREWLVMQFYICKTETRI